MLGKGGLATAVGTENSHKAALLNFQIHILKNRNAGRVLYAGIGVGQMLYRYDITQIEFLHQGVQRPVAPQGSTRPDSVTGSPSSPASVFPPYRLPNTASEAYATAEGARPVV